MMRAQVLGFMAWLALWPTTAAAEPLRVQPPLQVDWARSFDNAGWSQCPAGTYLTGLYKGPCGKLGCIEFVKCAKAEAPGEAARMTAWWANSFDIAGRSSCPEGHVLAGFERTAGDPLGHLENALCVRPKTPDHRRGEVRWQACSDVPTGFGTSSNTWASCPTGTFMTALDRIGDATSGLEALTSMRCCALAHDLASETNLARGKPARQSSTALGGAAERAVDGNRDGSFGAGSVTHTEEQDAPWWEVDLGADRVITGIRVFNRTDCCGERLTGYAIELFAGPDGSQREVVLTSPANPSAEITLPANTRARRVRISLPGRAPLSLAEVEVWGPTSK